MENVTDKRLFLSPTVSLINVGHTRGIPSSGDILTGEVTIGRPFLGTRLVFQFLESENLDAFVYIPAQSLGSISLRMGTERENGKTTVEEQILGIWPDLHAIDRRRAIPRERHRRWLVEWEWNAASDVQDIPESSRNAPLVRPLSLVSSPKRAARSRGGRIGGGRCRHPAHRCIRQAHNSSRAVHPPRPLQRCKLVMRHAPQGRSGLTR